MTYTIIPACQSIALQRGGDSATECHNSRCRLFVALKMPLPFLTDMLLLYAYERPIRQVDLSLRMLMILRNQRIVSSLMDY